MMQRGRPWEMYKDRIIKAVQDYSLSETFGWTPNEIDEMDYERKMEYLSLMSGMAEAQNEQGSK